MQLFLDANVIFAAAISPEGRAQALFTLAAAGYSTLLTSGFAADEARRNVARKYPDASDRLERLLEACAFVPEATPGELTWAFELLPAKEPSPYLIGSARRESPK